MSNKRTRYRVRPNDTAEVSVLLIRPEKKEVLGKVVDVSAGGLALLFDRAKDPLCVLKEVVHLKICSEHLNEPLTTLGVVNRRESAPKGLVYGFELIDWLGLLTQLPPELCGLFNQRGEFRAQPDPDHPIDVVLEGMPLKVPAWLRDISARGLSFCAPSNSETLLLNVQKVRLSLVLPGIPERMGFDGDILHQNLSEEGICYGVYFDEKRTPRFDQKQKLIIQYMRERQRQWVQLLLAK